MFVHAFRFNGSIPEALHGNAAENDGDAKAQPPGNHYTPQAAYIDGKAPRREDAMVEE